MKKISIVICTYNRADLLKDCLASLTEQNASTDQFEVLTINNNSTDHTVRVGTEFSASYAHYRLITEEEQGLSRARNRGYKEAEADWLLYLDDDAIFPENLVERALWLIEHYV